MSQRFALRGPALGLAAATLLAGGMLAATRPAQSASGGDPNPVQPDDTRTITIDPRVPPPIERPWIPPVIAPHPIITRNLSLTRYALSGEINGSTATSRVSLDFRNDTGGILEGDFVFPVPAGAIVSDFALRDGDKRLNPELLDAPTARNWYEEIVRQAIDPGLLEYIDQSAYRVRAFPFAAGQTRTIELTFTHMLPPRGSMHAYTVPLQFAMPNTALIRNLQNINGGMPIMEDASTRSANYWVPPSPQFVVTVDIDVPTGLGSVASPTHTVAVNRTGNTSARVSAEAPLGATPEFSLLIGRAHDEFTASVLTYPGEGNEDGYFIATVYPSAPVNAKPQPKDVVLVLDTSGSMEGEKWTQAQGALEYVVRHLDASDRLALIDYDDLVNEAWNGYRTADNATKEEASRYIHNLTADGGTNINDALERAAAQIRNNNDPTRPDYLLFFTDGLPTVGETDASRIAANIASALSTDARLFSFGVGYDVNTMLLDQLARDHHGTSDYVEPNQNIESVVSAFYQKIQRPALTDINLQWNGLDAYGIQPARLPDLFHGTELTIAGRFRGRPSGNVTLTINGTVAGKSRAVNLTSPVTPDRRNDFVPRVWANMRVGRLMEQLRTTGQNPELMKEIESLARRFGIVTPYTSYLVRDDVGNMFDRERSMANLEDRAMAAPMESGASAVQQSKSANARQSSGGALGYGGGAVNADEMAPEDFDARLSTVEGLDEEGTFDFPSAEKAKVNGVATQQMVNTGNLTFLRQGAGMVDSRYEPERTIRVVQVAAFSDRYFALLEARPDLGDVFSQSSEVTVMVAPDLALQTVLLDDSGQPVPQSQVNALRNVPASQSPTGYNAATDSDWRSLMEALQGDYFQG